MPTLNEAAEALRLRAALKNHKHTDACLSYAAEKRHRYCITECRDSYESALAATPAEVVKAIQGVVRAAVELRKFEQSPFDPIEGRDDHKWNNLRFRLDCAIAAYRAALGGTDGPR